MARIMIQGTASSAGKSLMCTGLCRIFSDAGYRVVPFKSQNMSSKYYETKDRKKISTAQALQAFAARVEPSEKMNPVLMLPSSHMGSDIIVNGESIGHMKAVDYFEYKKSLRPQIKAVYDELEAANDIVVLEGAGSPAEINLNAEDWVNMGMADIADANVLLVSDIDRGGVFASIYGTVMLMKDEWRARIKGIIINKFRGDVTLLEPGIKMIEELTNIPVVGVVPYDSYELVDEDSIMDYEKMCNTNPQTEDEMEAELSRLAENLKESLDMEYIYSIMGL